MMMACMDVMCLYRKRWSQSHGVEMPAADMRTSASSRDGADEYSSEASEIDTCGAVSSAM